MKETTQDNIIWAIGLIDIVVAACMFFWWHFKYWSIFAFIIFIFGVLLILGDAMKQSYKETFGKYKETSMSSPEQGNEKKSGGKNEKNN